MTQAPQGVHWSAIDSIVDPDGGLHPDTARFKIRADTNAPTGADHAWVDLDPHTGGEDWPQFHFIKVLCSLKRGNCSKLEIVDYLADSVISPGNDTFVIGEPVALYVRVNQGPRGDSFLVVNQPTVRWGAAGAGLVQQVNLNVNEGGVVPYHPEYWDGNIVTVFSCLVPGTCSANVTADLSHQFTSDTGAPGLHADATMTVIGPTNVTLTSHTIAGGPSVGGVKDHPLDPWLRFGKSDDTVGIGFTFTAHAPAGVDGYVFGTQLVNSQTSSLGNPATDWSYWNTGGSYYLDSCVLYDDADTNVGSSFSWSSSDSPGAPLISNDTLTTAEDHFKMYFLFWSFKPWSVPAPLGKLEWYWDATARKDTTNATWGWSIPSGNESWSSNPSGAPSADFPTYSHVLPNSGACGIFPPR